MNKYESKMWDEICRVTALNNDWDADRIENKIGSPGIPDVAYSFQDQHGWIENKSIQDWPMLKETEVKIKTFTPVQRYWLYKRGNIAGNCWLLLWVRGPGEYLLFDWMAAQLIGGMTEDEMTDKCVAMWDKGISFNRFLEDFSRIQKVCC